MNVLPTVIFVDISGSTSLYEILGNERATGAVTQLTQWICDSIESHGGRVVKKLGDGVLGIFGDASTAVVATSAMLRRHQSRLHRWPQPVRMNLRIGMASGEVVDVDGDCYGDAVNVASRLCERAGPSEIWATEAAVMLAGAVADVWYRKLGVLDIRGKTENLMLYQIAWRENEEPDSLTMQAGLVSSFAPPDSILGEIQFSWHGVDRAFKSTEAPIHIGRATDMQLCINDPRVSRLHARIDWRNSGFVLTDMSSFGTWVRFEGSTADVRLRRDTCILHGAGSVALGVSFSRPIAPVLTFQVVGANVRLS
jgi:adenylate cyclase